MDHLQPLRIKRVRENGVASQIAARPVEAGDEAEPDRVAADGEDDWNRAGRALGGKRSRGGLRRNGSDAQRDEVKHMRPHRIELSLRKPIFDSDVLPFDIAGFTQAPGGTPPRSALRAPRSGDTVARSSMRVLGQVLKKLVSGPRVLARTESPTQSGTKQGGPSRDHWAKLGRLQYTRTQYSPVMIALFSMNFIAPPSRLQA